MLFEGQSVAKTDELNPPCFYKGGTSPAGAIILPGDLGWRQCSPVAFTQLDAPAQPAVHEHKAGAGRPLIYSQTEGRPAEWGRPPTWTCA